VKLQAGSEGRLKESIKRLVAKLFFQAEGAKAGIWGSLYQRRILTASFLHFWHQHKVNFFHGLKTIKNRSRPQVEADLD
jgi:hypothetical protein